MTMRLLFRIGASLAIAASLVLVPGSRAQDQDKEIGGAKPKETTQGDDPTAASPQSDGPAAPGRARHQEPRVLDAFRTVPRHRFLPPKTQRQAYDDESIPIGEGQTITPPYDVAFMTEVLDPKPTDGSTRSAPVRAISRRSSRGWSRTSIPSRSTRRCPSGRPPVHKSSVTPTFTRASATATWAGPRPLRSTRSSSRALPRRCRSRSSTSSRKGGGW